MIEVRQWILTNKLADLINSSGWSATEETKAFADKGMGDIDLDKWLHKYTHVANVEASDLEEVFSLMNRWDQPERVHRLADLHSLSVGDVLIKDGKSYMVDDFGFKELSQ